MSRSESTARLDDTSYDYVICEVSRKAERRAADRKLLAKVATAFDTNTASPEVAARDDYHQWRHENTLPSIRPDQEDES